ncbi:unnamed protein product [Umbelopsis ramanniana]
MKNEKIVVRNRRELNELIGRIEDSGQQELDNNPSARRPQFGTLIKVLMLDFEPDPNIQLKYGLLNLSRLAFLTPNIHTLRIIGAHYYHGITYWQPRRITYDWEVELASKLPKLVNLTLTEYRREAEFVRHKNTKFMLQRLHTLDILQYPRFTWILPHTMTHLRSLKLCIGTEESLQRLMTILENCGRSLHTLVINTCGPHDYLDDTHFNLNEIVELVPNLMAFGFAYASGRPLMINSLPSQLEELEMNATNDELFYFEAAHDHNLERESEGFRVPTLKKFRMDFKILDCYMLKILMANKDTLEELVLCKSITDTEKAMVMLQEKHVRMEKVVNLTFFNPIFDDETSLLETKAVFPHVEVITMFYAYEKTEDDDVSKALGIWFSTLPHLKEVYVISESTKVYKVNVIETRKVHTLF